MNRSVILIALFLGVMVSANKAEAAVKNIDNFKGFQTAQNSPWDPREEESAQDDTGRENEPSQTEE